MTKKLFALMALAGLAVPAPAQEAVTFTVEDAEAMVSCIEAGLAAVAEDTENWTIARQTDCIGAASGLCMDQPDASSTIAMSECLDRERDWWDSQLNTHYAALRESLAPEISDQLLNVQRAWMEWRDETCGFEYTLWGEGTMRILVGASCMLEETARRAEVLASYLDAAPLDDGGD